MKKSQQNVETCVMSLKGTRHQTGVNSDLTWTCLGLHHRCVSLSSKLPDVRKLFRHM